MNLIHLPRSWRDVIAVLVTAVVFYLVGSLGFTVSLPPAADTTPWPVSGIALAALMVLGWPGGVGVFIGAFLSFYGRVSGPYMLQAVAAIALVTVIQAWLTAHFIRLLSKNSYPSSIAHVVGALVVAAITSVIAPDVRAGAYYFSGNILASDFGSTILSGWLSDLIGMLVVAPPLVIFALRWQGKTVKEPFLWPLTSFVMGIALLSFILVRTSEQRQLTSALKNDAIEITHVIQDEIDQNISDLTAIRSLYMSSRQVELDEFMIFSQHLRSSSTLSLGYSWAPKVTKANLRLFEESVRASFSQSFNVYEQDQRGIFTPVADREWYYPITLVEPFNTNAGTLGFDLGSSPACLEAIQLATDSGNPAATMPINLVQDYGYGTSFMVMMPIYRNDAPVETVSDRRSGLLGIAVESFHVNDLIRRPVEGINRHDLELYFFDITNPVRPVMLAFYPSISGKQSLSSADPQSLDDLRTGDFTTMLLAIGGRNWVMLARPGPDYQKELNGLTEWAALLVGFFLAGGFLAFVNARQKTEAVLVQSEAQFRALSDNALTGVMRMKRTGEILYANDATAHIFGEPSPAHFLRNDLAAYAVNPLHFQMIEDLLFANGEVRGQDLEIRTAQGEIRQLLISAGLYKDIITATLVDITERIRADKEIQQLSLVVTQTADSVVITDVEGVIEYVNPAFERQTGFTRSDAIGQTPRILKSGQVESDFYDRLWRNILDGQVFEGEFANRKKNGELFYEIKTITPVFNEQHFITHFVATGKDITERKRNEAELEKYREHLEELVRERTSELALSEERYRVLFNAGSDAMFVLELFDDGSPSRFVEVNEVACSRLGLTRAEFLAMPFEQLPVTYRSKSTQEAVRQLREQGFAVWEETQVVKDQHEMAVEISAHYFKLDGKQMVISVARDITERKAIEEQIRRSNFLADTALELAHAGYWHVPVDQSGTYIASDRAIAIYGNPYHADHRYLLREEWFENARLGDESAALQARKVFYDILEGRTLHADAIYAYRRPVDDRVIWVHSVGNLVRSQDGKTANIFGVSQDITEQKLLEMELLKAKDQAETANRAKSTFLANMSHEIRTPMNAILGFAQLIMGDTNLPAKHRQHIEIINRSGEHLLTLINEILEMSKIEAGHVQYHPVAFDLPALARDVENMFRLRVEAKNLQFDVELAPDLPRYIISDDNKFKQILINLLGNAIKFTQQGAITFRMATGNSSTSAADPTVRLVIDVEDTGMGIAPEEMAKLFRAFEQTRSGTQVKGGTGLGLVISQTYARLMGGEISVISQPGVGSCFRLEVLVEKTDSAKVEQEIPARKVTGIQPGRENLRVLVVDDNLENRQLLFEILERVKLHAREACDGEQAVAQFHEWQPDIVLMDLRMPVLDGYEATRRIKQTEAGRRCPVIALTASIVDIDRQKVYDCGMSGFMRKPFKESELFAILEEKLGSIFIYDEVNPAGEVTGAAAEAPSGPLTTEALQRVPAVLIEKMSAATLSARFDELLELIDQVEADDALLAARLRELANDFQYDALMALFTRG